MYAVSCLGRWLHKLTPLMVLGGFDGHVDYEPNRSEHRKVNICHLARNKHEIEADEAGRCDKENAADNTQWNLIWSNHIVVCDPKLDKGRKLEKHAQAVGKVEHFLMRLSHIDTGGKLTSNNMLFVIHFLLFM